MKRKNNRKRKVNKKLWTMLTASILAAALGTIGILHHLEPMEAYAKETLSGTKQVVNTHTGDKPFVILDVVPDYAAYAWKGNADDTFEIRTGTLGYLVKGQSTMETDYAAIYEKKKTELSTYEQRAALVSEIWKSGSGDSNLVFQYEEAYGSTRMELNRADENGWKLLIPSASLKEEDKTLGETAHSGLMRGYFKVYDASTAGSTQGYDYIKVGNWNESITGVSREVYEFDAQKGTYQVRFITADSGVTAGYFVDAVTEITDVNKVQYSLGTSLYTRKSNGSDYIYTYAGTIAEKFPVGNGLTAGYSTEIASPKLSPSPTETSSTEKTSAPTQTSTLEKTPVPTQTPTMEKTPVPTQTPTPEKTPVPTQTPTPEKTPTPTQTQAPTPEKTLAPTQTPESEEDDKLTVTTVTVTNKETYAVYEQTQDYGELTLEDDDQDAPVNGPVTESYYVVTFKYESNIQTGETRPVYKADTITAIPEGSSTRPYDVYTKNGDSEEKTFLYVGAGQGQYKLTDQADISKEEKRIQEPVWMVVRNAPTYFRYTGGCDWLKQYVFHVLTDGDNQNADFAIRIQTVRADELTEEMIRNAELIYLESGAAPFINTANSKVTLNYLDKSNESKSITQNDGTILPIGVTQENVYAVVYRAVNELLPVIVDAQTVWNAPYPDSNYQKMARIFQKEDLETYLKDANGMTDVLLNQLDSSEYPDCTDNGFHYVNHNIYVVNGTTPLVNGDFAQSFDEGSAQSGFGEVLGLIQSENYLNAGEDKIQEQVSKARAVEYIINYSIGLSVDFTDLNVLELQPTQNDTANLFGENDEDENGGTTLYCQKSDERESGARKRQVIRSSKKINVDVEVKSVSGFNSEWEDINQNYNLVFIGLDGQRLNHSEDRYHTVGYNDRDLNGKLYHSGDRTGNSEDRYDPSDITERKKNELLDFMRAGYPVLVENEMFIGKSAKNGADRINTKYVANDTWMYEFLSRAVSDEELKNRIYTINDLYSSILFMEQLSVDHPVVNITNIEEAAIEEGSDGTLAVGLSYGISNRKGDSYDGECSVEFYLDINDDGNYTAAEQISGGNVGGDGIQAIAGNGQVTVSFKETPGSRAIPYRLKVSDSNNSYRRSSVEGVLQIMDAQKETIRILQIGDKDEASLSNLYQKTDSTLGYYLKAAENEMNVKFDIETVDSKVLTQRFEKNQDCLNQWDLLILGFGNGSESLSPNMIERYIQEGHSVLITGKGASGERLLLSGTLLGQLDRKTYGSLGYTSGTSYFRYADLDAGMFGEQNNMKVAALNNGSVFSYPLSVGRSAQLQGDVSFKAYDYLLDLGRTEAPFVTPWFTFAGSGNDNDTNAYNVSPNDGANNYYLYSKGNVVFIGNDDYSSYTYDVDNPQNPTGTGLQESQMFVNAMMLAYDSGVHNLKVDIVAGFDTTAAKVASISIPFDKDLENQSGSGLLDEMVDVYFRFKNSNLTLSNAYDVKFYYEDAAGGTFLDVGDEKVQVTPFTSSLWTVQDNTLTEVAASQIRQGKVYRFKAPVIALQNNTAATNAKIYVEVVSALERPDGSEGAGSKEVRGYDSVTFTRTQLFLLE